MMDNNSIDIKFNTIEEAIEDIKSGKLLIVVDDEQRENEGDFVAAAQMVTPEMINFMAINGRGLICTPLTEKRCSELELELMVGKNTSLHATPFTVSVDLIGHGCTTGISAHDRAKTIKALVDRNTKPDDLGRPGHIFPLKAKDRGVIQRAGHTEAVVDLARLAGLEPVGVLVEIMNEDGTMARLPELMVIAQKFQLKIISIEALITYRLRQESLIEQGEMVLLPTEFGNFNLIPFLDKNTKQEHIALIKGTWLPDEPVLTRVHSSCVTGDIFGSLRCDCGLQLHKAMQMIEKEGKGVIVYMSQEGRGIGLFNKIKAYKLQEQGMDTVEANIALGFNGDERDYGVGAQILKQLGVRKMRLLTNNPIKRIGLEGFGIEITENVNLEVPANQHNHFYMETKRDKMGHFLHLMPFEQQTNKNK
ncbi:MAG: bifunctional 3,4-dihydroxy-2-butanone-4-phosphate synthase/GTP cyclohydrolase II [Salinivirgaceae bacterium]